MVINPSAVELAYAIYANVLKMNENRGMLNSKYAEKKAADSIRGLL